MTYLLSATVILQTYLLGFGRTRGWGWLAGIGSNTLWILWAFSEGHYGLLLSSIPLLGICSVNFIKELRADLHKLNQ